MPANNVILLRFRSASELASYQVRFRAIMPTVDVMMIKVIVFFTLRHRHFSRDIFIYAFMLHVTFATFFGCFSPLFVTVFATSAMHYAFRQRLPPHYYFARDAHA